MHHICSEALKSLVIKWCDRENDERIKVEVDAPSLTQFEFHDLNNTVDYTFKNFDPLDEVLLDVAYQAKREFMPRLRFVVSLIS